MTATDFTTTVWVDQNPKEAFNAINNVRGWWSEEIEGHTTKLNDEFSYHYEDLHRCQLKLIEVIPDKKIVWLVKDNYFKFTKDKTEWTGTKISFEISRQDGKTQIRFIHLGLVPAYECYDICRNAWTTYIQNSLRGLIATGKGQPNGLGKPGTGDEKKLSAANKKIQQEDYVVRISVNATAQKAFECINNVTEWWTKNLEGRSKKLNDEFTVRFDDVHVSKQKLIEVNPGKKVVWLITDSHLNFLQDKHEWTNTSVSFEIDEKDDKTQITFTHIGLVPQAECYKACTNAWSQYIKGSLFELIVNGKGTPELA